MSNNNDTNLQNNARAGVEHLKSGISVAYMRKIVRSILARITLFGETVVYLNKSHQTIDGTLTVTKEFTASKVYNAVWNDYAELFERGCDTEPGDVIAIDTSSDKEVYVLANRNKFSKVVGVHTNEYGHLIGGENPKDNADFLQYNLPKYIPVGLAGRVKTKVVGTCKKGDWMVVSDIDGVARSYNEDVDSSLDVFGMACEDKNNSEIERIKVYLK